MAILPSQNMPLENQPSYSNEGLPGSLSAKQWLIVKLLVWNLCSMTALYTTKILMLEHGYHYPLTIAFRFFTTQLMLSTILTYIHDSRKYCSGRDENASRSDFSFFRHGSLCSLSLPRQWKLLLPPSIAAAGSITLMLESILHLPNLAALVMLFPLVYACESFILWLSGSTKYNGHGMQSCLFVVAACGLLLYNESRLTVPGLVFGISSTILAGVARASLHLAAERTRSTSTSLDIYRCFIMMTSFSGLTLSGFTSYFMEGVRTSALAWSVIWPIMILNLGSMLGTSLTGIVTYWSWVDEEILPRSLALFTLAVSSLVLITLSTMTPAVGYISPIQTLTFLAANSFLLGFGEVQKLVIICLDFIHFQRAYTNDNSIRSRWIATGLITFIVAGLSFTLTTISSISIHSLSPGQAAAYDYSYGPRSRFDIVVSMYIENPIEVRHTLDQILSTAFIRSLNAAGHQPQIIIYTKNPDANLNEIYEIVGADLVEKLENVGREGGTYLTHIVNKWNSLAEQTLFIQAHAHNLRELIPRINDYLVYDTGMLSLGFAGVTCYCGRCADRWGWTDKSGDIPAIYEAVYHKPCHEKQRLLLSYKGQFVASARRIRGINREVYARLLNTVTMARPNRTEVSGEIIGGVKRKDTPSNPYFGFTLERVWSLLMQCGTNEYIAAKCPSLLSGKVIGGSQEDCQCLDEIGQ